MYQQIMGWIAVLVLATGMAHAATLGIPTPHTTLSGIGVISGWKCDAGELTVRFNGGVPLLLSLWQCTPPMSSMMGPATMPRSGLSPS